MGTAESEYRKDEKIDGVIFTCRQLRDISMGLLMVTFIE